MVESSTETGISNASFVTKKKLKMPTPFSEKREDLRKFLQEVKTYLLANSGIYTSNLDKVHFVLSYITEEDANSWKEEFYTLLSLKLLVTKLKLEENEAVMEYFRETLPIPLQKNIMTLEKPLITLNKQYELAIKLQNKFVHMKSAIAKSQNWGGSAPPTPNKKSNEKGPWRSYFDVGKEDPNTMDIDVMSMEKQAALMRKGACFICKETGHLARDHKKQMEKENDLPKKMKGKKLHAHVRALLP